MSRPTAEEIRKLLHLERHPIEGGDFIRTYESSHTIPLAALPTGYFAPRQLATAIYYLLAPGTFSELHRLPGDEIFHFYMGDPVELVELRPDGTGARILLGHDIPAGMRPQHVVPGGVWQGSRLVPGGEYARLGTTMSPGFDYADYETGARDRLTSQYPAYAEQIALLTR
jgi:uncharacterized protein